MKTDRLTALHRAGLVCGFTFMVFLINGALGVGGIFGVQQAKAARALPAQNPRLVFAECQPFLEEAKVNAQTAATTIDSSSYAAKKAALTLGLFLGVAQAIGPTETGLKKQSLSQNISALNHPAKDPVLSGNDTGQARSIAAYRHCANQKILEARNTLNGPDGS